MKDVRKNRSPQHLRALEEAGRKEGKKEGKGDGRREGREIEGS
jgi:hypothetical protein